MPPNKKVLEAYRATRILGIPDDEVKPVLRDLLRTYDGNWKLIEEDNYRTLLDAYFEHKDSEGLEGKRSCVVDDDKPGRPHKKLHEGEQQNRFSPTIDSSGHKLAVKKCKTSALVTVKETSKLSRHCVDIRPDEDSSSLEPTPVVYSDQIGASCRGNMELSPYQKCSSSEHIRLRPVNSEVFREQLSNFNNKCSSSSEHVRPLKTAVAEGQHARYNKKSPSHHGPDLTKGAEKVKISWVNEIGEESLPKFIYIPNNIIFQSAKVIISLARISDEDCCSSCSGDCLSSSYPCACARETGGEFAYTSEGLLKEDFLKACISMRCEPKKEHLFYCQDCPVERIKNGYMPDQCKGHLLRKFIKECWRKCGCDMRCGNRVVQRGITCKLQVFFTCETKGWGLRTLRNLPKGTFVCEYVGEVLTNTELYDRNIQSTGNERHTYPVTLDADWGSEGALEDDELLCLDATNYGNVARFINHRCFDANLVDIPVEVETPDRHYYHLAFFTSREVNAFEELTWDYAIDFEDEEHPVKAFRCCCESKFCRDKKKGSGKSLARTGKSLSRTSNDLTTVTH